MLADVDLCGDADLFLPERVHVEREHLLENEYAGGNREHELPFGVQLRWFDVREDDELCGDGVLHLSERLHEEW